MWTLFTLDQMQESWHRQGMFMEMHWAWWLLWIVAVVIVVWAFVRLAADRSIAKRDAARFMTMEAEARERHARGEIDDHELSRELSALARATPVRGR